MLYSDGTIRSAVKATPAGALAVVANTAADGLLMSTNLLLVKLQAQQSWQLANHSCWLQSSHRAVSSGLPVAHASLR